MLSFEGVCETPVILTPGACGREGLADTTLPGSAGCTGSGGAASEFQKAHCCCYVLYLRAVTPSKSHMELHESSTPPIHNKNRLCRGIATAIVYNHLICFQDFCMCLRTAKRSPGAAKGSPRVPKGAKGRQRDKTEFTNKIVPKNTQV